VPRELKEINKFVTGTVTSASERDIPDDSASFSLNIDSFSESGTLRGIPTDSTILNSYELNDTIQLDFDVNEEDNDLVITGGAWENPVINEGATGTISIRLTSQPTSNVVVNTSSSRNSGIGGIGITGGLTFTTSNWNTNQNVTLTAVDSDYARADISSTILFTTTSDDSDWASSTALDHWTKDVVNRATNTAGLVHNIPSHILLGEASSNAATYNVKLGSKPSGDNSVTVNLNESATHFNLSPAFLTFTSSNWNTNQTFTVTAVNNSLTTTNPTEHFNLITASSASEYSGLDIDRLVSVTNDDSTDEPPTCFAEGTLISTVMDLIPIEQINIGDSVLCYNFDSKSVEVNTVKYLSQHDFNENKEDIYEIEVGNQKLIGTASHEIATTKGNYKPISELKVGNYIVTPHKKAKITYIKLNKDYKEKLYNLEMESTPHNYFANNILVHNGVWDGSGGGGKNPSKPDVPKDTFSKGYIIIN